MYTHFFYLVRPVREGMENSPPQLQYVYVQLISELHNYSKVKC